MARRFQDPEFTERMRYVQSTLAPGLDASQPCNGPGRARRSAGWEGRLRARDLVLAVLADGDEGGAGGDTPSTTRTPGPRRGRWGPEADGPEELVADAGGVQGVGGLAGRGAGVVTLDDVLAHPGLVGVPEDPGEVEQALPGVLEAAGLVHVLDVVPQDPPLVLLDEVDGVAPWVAQNRSSSRWTRSGSVTSLRTS